MDLIICVIKDIQIFETSHYRICGPPRGRMRTGRNQMTVSKMVHILAGAFILASLALAHFVNPNWLWFTAFVGANLFQSGLTNWCMLSKILKKAGLPEETSSC